MEKIAFVGSYDKTDLLLYMAKILTILNKKVIVIDTTALQKSRYVVPAMQPLKKYITTFQAVDVAIGFESFEDIKQYQTEHGEWNVEYDFALIDIDSARGYRAFEILPENKHYFITSFDIYCLRRGLQVFKALTAPVKVTKVLFTKDMLASEDEYLNHLSAGLRLKWNSEIVFFPFENGDQNIIYANQRSSRIRIKGLSVQYMDSLMFLIEDFSKMQEKLVRKAVKILEKN